MRRKKLDFNINLKNKDVLITGAAYFEDFHLVMLLLSTVLGIHIEDNMIDYYDGSIKKYHLGEIEKFVIAHPHCTR